MKSRYIRKTIPRDEGLDTLQYVSLTCNRCCFTNTPDCIKMMEDNHLNGCGMDGYYVKINGLNNKVKIL